MTKETGEASSVTPAKLASVWLSLRIGSAPGAYASLTERYGSAEAVLALKTPPDSDLQLKPSVLRALADKSLDRERGILDYCVAHRIMVLTPADTAYPALLRNLPDLPAVLYVSGTLPDFSRVPATAVVGTRTMTEYGMLRAYDIGYGLARGGSAVVSGMAAGGDGMALAGALDAGGTPVAVLGCGVDVAYPRGHALLMEEISRRGAVISEYPPGTEIRAQNFPERNRIISGISRAVCVTEAALHSGAMITARLAVKQARELFAVPGEVGAEGSAGTNELLRDAASPVLTAQDVLAGYLFLYPDRISAKPAEPRTAEEAERSAAAHMIDLGAPLRKAQSAGKKPDGTQPPLPRIKLKKSDINTTEAPDRQAGKQTERESEKLRAALMLTDEATQAVYRSLPDGAFTPDEALCGRDIGDLLCALTVLEVHGLVRALPGGRFERT